MQFPSPAKVRSKTRRLASGLYGRLLQLTARRGLTSVFDRDFYLQANRDVAQSGMDPLAHFMLYGARECRRPHPLFDALYYVRNGTEENGARANPLVHYLRHGWKEFRRPHPLFEPAWYALEYGVPDNEIPLLDYVRRSSQIPGVCPRPSLDLFLSSQPPGFETPALTAPVDVIMLLSGSPDALSASLESVQASLGQLAHDVLLVSDGLDPVALANIRALSDSRGCVLIDASAENPSPLKRALELHPDRDVVIVSPGTQVVTGWIDRLAAAAYTDSRIATASPFSNDGGPCSYPLPFRVNRLPEGESVETLDALFRRVNGGSVVKLRRASGPCMYVRRDWLRVAGLNVVRRCPSSNGQMDGICLDRPADGWAHMLAAGVFVFRDSEMRGSACKAEGDFAAYQRFAVSAARMKQSSTPVILLVTHALEGGISEYVRRLAGACAGRAEFILCIPYGNAVVLESVNPDYAFSLAVDAEQDYQLLPNALRRCGVTRMHIQHTHGYSISLRRLHRDLDVPFDFTIHDYFAVCPQMHLIDVHARYCGEPGEDGCNRCVIERPPDPPSLIAPWRREHSWLLQEAGRVIAPSMDTALRMARYAPGVQIVHAPHPDRDDLPVRRGAPPLAENEPLHIALIGTLARHKGLDRVRECASIARRNRLPLEFTLIGQVDPGLTPRLEQFQQVGRYESGELPDLLRAVRPHLAWFPSEVPETYSYTLSAALRAGLPVVVPDLGALPERVAGLQWTWVTPAEWDSVRLAEFFVNIREQNFIARSPPPASVAATEVHTDFYASGYLEPVWPGNYPSHS